MGDSALWRCRDGAGTLRSASGGRKPPARQDSLRRGVKVVEEQNAVPHGRVNLPFGPGRQKLPKQHPVWVVPQFPYESCDFAQLELPRAVTVVMPPVR